MRPDDKGQFTKLLAATMDVYGRQITSSFVDVFFSALTPYPLEIVREALNRHIQDPEAGRFAPKPADLIRQVVSAKASDGRPGRDEAWAIAQKSADNDETVVTSEEILEAFDIARPLLEDLGDKVAARMAFVEAYDRIVSDKRAAGIKFEWFVSLGDNKERRAPAIRAAQEAGLLSAPRAIALIEANTEVPMTSAGLAIAGLLAAPDGKATTLKPEEMRQKWKDLKSQIGRKADDRKLVERQQIAAAEAELQAISRSKREES